MHLEILYKIFRSTYGKQKLKDRLSKFRPVQCLQEAVEQKAMSNLWPRKDLPDKHFALSHMDTKNYVLMNVFPIDNTASLLNYQYYHGNTLENTNTYRYTAGMIRRWNV